MQLESTQAYNSIDTGTIDSQENMANQPLEKSTDNITDYIWHRYLFKKGCTGIKILKMI
jgi:hypothetical protein